MEKERIKLLLLLPADAIHRFKVGNFKKSLRYAPITLTYLAALIPKDLDIDLKLLDEGNESINSINFEPDLVAISVMTGTSSRAYTLADNYRKKGVKVVMGGVHPTLLPDEAALHADTVVVGFAERSFPQLLIDFQKGKMKKFYIDREQMPLNKIPIPRRDLLNKKDYITINTIIATRGCPNRCKFCVVPYVWNKKYFRRPINDIINEIKTLEGNHVVFIDVNLLEDDNYTRELLTALIPLKKYWFGLSTIKALLNKAIMNLVIKSGCKGLLIGFESVTNKSLISLNKGFNNVAKYADMMKILHDNGIRVNGTFLFGTDVDDKSVFEETVKFVDRIKIDLPRFSVFTPYPGTQIFKELEKQDRIIEYDWAMYDVEHVVFKPKLMSPEELEEGLHWAWKETYSIKSIFKRITGTTSILGVILLTNLGYKYYANKLPKYNKFIMTQE